MKSKINLLLTFLALLLSQQFFAQAKSVSGTILDEGGVPLPGVTILEKGTKNGTQSDFDGNYQIKVNDGAVLVFSFIGMLPQEVVVSSSKINITMKEDVTELESVVVTALGIKRKPDEITTASQVVKTDELNQAKATNAAVGLVGKVSGLQINTINNGVNPNTRIQLRGFRSISGNNEALIVINGVISTSGAFSELNPEIIESINVIKGSNGAALYGSQGSNGVIIVTTKKGNKEESKFNIALNSSITFEEVSMLPKLQNRFGQGYQGAQDFTENTSWGPELDGSLQPTGLEQTLMPYSFIKDNYKPFFNTGTTQLNSIAVSSGDENGYVNLSIGNQETSGIIPSDTFKKNNFNFSGGKSNDKWSLNANLRYTTSHQNTAGGVEGSVYNSLTQVPVNVPVEAFSNPDNATHWTYWELSPYWRLKNERIDTKGQTIEGVGEIGYKINKNIDATYRASFRTTSFNGYEFFNGYVAEVVYWDSPFDYVSSYEVNNSNSRRIYSDFLLNFNYMLTNDISFKANVGNNITSIESNASSIRGERLVVPGLYNISNITGNAIPTDFKSQQRGYAFFANVDFGYKDYLFLNLTGRNDWTSVLNKNNNSFFYPSAGVSFIPTKAFENFGGEILNYAKLSASIVKVGNAIVGPYDINDRFLSGASAGFPYSTINSFVQNLEITDGNLRNENNISKEINLNLEFYKRRITFDASYYSSKNTDQILQTSPSSASGANVATINVGETTSTGIELDLGLTPVKTDNITWDIRFGYSAPKTVVDKVTETSTQVAVGDYLGTAGIAAIAGEQFPMIVGTGYQRDENGNVVIDASTGDPLKATNVKLGKTTPDYILGLSTSLRYKNFKLSGVFDYRTGHVFYAGVKDGLIQNGTDIATAQGGRQPFIFPNSVIETSPGVYTENNTITTSGGQDYYTGIYREIDENFVLDATAFKCREIALTYTFSKDILSHIGIDGLSIGFNARNVFMILPKENRNYTDPEFSFTTGNNVGLSTGNQAPPTRTYGINFNLTF
ncbi:SusC/RagA family TonB-linked outer membrane protein [Flavobacterium cheniae]|jgi:TonB-linked SusC/RagA family outer membrane protein|uniref:TonB-linked SusC/RagA family outer membrane protein n=1 Tax=Flavobacterium cheniae TaxID=295428 RepID=A0A562KPG2_9FLAO|nr:SusC/RagA family TonB-linked outer membrane protein [Flavobacterium cheniae]TDR22877.1 TonB-linked SusC/RagA family outer membrane protein [Flavobacterium cheniae]TWH97262.1 TonB-linked SusC/RagA family outer membrane protein [Flavobacterium cheniae]